MNVVKITLLSVSLIVNAQNLFVGNTMRNIILHSKFKYYVVPFVKSYDDSILIKTQGNWKLAFAITLNNLLKDSLKASSINIKENKFILDNLNNLENLKKMLNKSAVIVYIDTFKVFYNEKRDYYTYSNKLQVVVIPEYPFNVYLRIIHIGEDVKVFKKYINFIWFPESGKNWKDIFINKIKEEL